MKIMLEWLTPEDGAPEDYEMVLIATDSGGVFLGYCITIAHSELNHDTVHWYYATGGSANDFITHWMPMPVSPSLWENRRLKYGKRTAS